MVFITQTDIFGHGIPIYTINRHFKEEGGRGKMCEAVEKYAEDYAEKYAEQKAENVRLNSLLESIKNLMESMKWSAEQAMAAMKVSDADKAMLLKKL